MSPEEADERQPDGQDSDGEPGQSAQQQTKEQLEAKAEKMELQAKEAAREGEEEGVEGGEEAEEAAGADEEPQREEPDFHVVGVGASAGGLSALQEFFRALPDQPGIAFIVIQHLAPTHSSHMADILARATAMKVAEARDGIPIEPNHVYTIPSDRFLCVEDGVLRLSEPFREEGRQLPIDFLFRSLAQVQRERGVAIVLSGTGSDGTLGIREIRAVGGLTMAQDPQTADYASMPRSAISSGAVDYVLDPTQMGERLIAYVHRAYPVARQAVQGQESDAVESILNAVSLRTHRDFRPYKRSTIRRRIERRMGLHQIADVQEYLELVRENEKEATELSREMLISVTSFFREQDAFDALQEQGLKEIVQAKPEQSTVRVWVPGCATGEEAYSLAILLHEMLIDARKTCGMQVFGTDVDEQALDIARRGVYPESIRADVSAERLERFFVKMDGAYKVGDQLRESLVFAPHDLLNEPPFSNMDLISCRNVLIYLESEAQRKVLDLFAFALKKDGYLFMGRSDALSGRDSLFETVSSEHRVFRRSTGTPHLLEFPVSPAQREFRGRLPFPVGGMRLDPRRLAELNQRVLLRHFGAAVVLARRNGEIVHFFGPVNRFLEHATGAASLTLSDMAGEHLSMRLTPALRKAAETGQTISLCSVAIVREGGSLQADVTVSAVPGPAEEDLVAVVFEETAESGHARQEASAPEQKAVVGDLQDELRASREDYRATVEELETANEELRAANEEVTSMNEELQATNEELQSSQEELQSVNEELQTLNDQLSQKLGELREANDDLSNLFRAADIPMIFVDAQLRLKRMAEPASRVINIQSSDIGRPLTDITHQILDTDPAEVARNVMANLAKVEREVDSRDGRRYLMQAVPYRTADDRIDGVVLSFTDISPLKGAERELRELNASLEARVAEATAVSRQRAEKLRQLALKLTSTEQRERQRLALQLHDTVQQTLAAARMNLQAVVDRASEDKVREAIERSCEMLRDAITTARGLTAELYPPTLYTGGLGTALQALAAHMQQRFGLRTDVHVHVPGELSTVSRILVYRCAQELLTNVAKHARTDRAEVHLEQGDEMLRLHVSDSGEGFEVALLDSNESDGFGLFSLRERIQSINGTLSVDSAPGKGTRVSIELPLLGRDEFAPDEADRRPRRTGGPEGDAELVRVLIADDHDIVRCAIADMVGAQKGLEVVGHAANGRQAVEKAWELLPDVVLMDVRMPEMDGLEATRRIMAELPGTIVIGLSAHEDRDMDRKMRQAGAAAFVDKGAPPERLLEALRRFGRGPG